MSPAEAVLKAEVLYRAEVLSRAEFASSSEYLAPFEFKMAERREIYSMPDPVPSEDSFKAQVSSGFEELPKVAASKSEASLGSDESSTLGENSVCTAFSGPEEPCSPEFSVPDSDARARHLLPDDEGGDAEPLLGEEPPLMALELLPGLHDPYAEVAAKLARFSSAVSGPDVPPVDVPKVTTQVPDVTQVDTRKFRGGGEPGGGVAASQGSGVRKRELWLRLCKPVGRSG